MSVEARRAAASQIARMAATEDGRAFLKRIGHRSGEPVLVVSPSDTVGEMFARIAGSSPRPPAVVAVAHERDGLSFLAVWPAHLGGAIDGDEHEIGDTSTVGLLLDYLATSGRRAISLSLTWGSSRAELVDSLA